MNRYAPRDQNLEPGAGARGAGLADRDAGDGEDLPGKEEPEAGVLPKSPLKDLLFLGVRDPAPVVLKADRTLLSYVSSGSPVITPEIISRGKKEFLKQHSGLPFPHPPPVPQCPGRRADIGASPAEIAFGLPVTAFCLVNRADLLTLPALNTRIRSLQGKEAYPGSKREEEPIRADDPAERAVEYHGDKEHHDKDDACGSQGQGKETADTKVSEKGGREDPCHVQEYHKNNPADYHQRNLLAEHELWHGHPGYNLLYGPDRAEVPAEEPAGYYGQQEYYREPDGCDHERYPKALHIAEHQLLELVRCKRGEDEKPERS